MKYRDSKDYMMPEQSNNGPTTAPESTTGLALMLGELRAELRHQTEEITRRLDELHADLAEEKAAREALENVVSSLKDIASSHQKMLTNMTALIEPMVEKMSAKNTGTSTAASNAGSREPEEPGASAQPPSRTRGESNTQFSKRLAAWAKEQGAPEPPRPQVAQIKDVYDQRVAAWAKENVSA